jgi:hypothetical protein
MHFLSSRASAIARERSLRALPVSLTVARDFFAAKIESSTVAIFRLLRSHNVL